MGHDGPGMGCSALYVVLKDQLQDLSTGLLKERIRYVYLQLWQCGKVRMTGRGRQWADRLQYGRDSRHTSLCVCELRVLYLCVSDEKSKSISGLPPWPCLMILGSGHGGSGNTTKVPLAVLDSRESATFQNLRGADGVRYFNALMQRSRSRFGLGAILGLSTLLQVRTKDVAIRTPDYVKLFRTITTANDLAWLFRGPAYVYHKRKPRKKCTTDVYHKCVPQVVTRNSN